MTWAEYWNSDTTIYVNAHHMRVHYDLVARDMIAHVPRREARVVDYGCGDTLSGDRVAEACGHLYLCDAAGRVRQRLLERYAGNPNISVLTPQQFEQLEPGTVDVIIVNSVVQYLTLEELRRLLDLARAKLRGGGRLVLADIVPRSVSLLGDAAELLKFGWRNGFLLPALAGLVRSYFSNYRTVRKGLGFLQLDEPEVLNMLEHAGFAATRHHRNIGHNPRRMTFVGIAR